MAPSTPSNDLLSHTTYERLRQLIMDGDLSPGTRIIETDLAPRLDVSRTTVGLALKKLESEGLVTRLDGKRARWIVAPLTRGGARELAEMLSVLEGLAGRRAALLGDDERLKLVSSLCEVNQRLRVIGKDPTPDSAMVTSLDREFHRLLLEVSAGPHLLAECDRLRAQFARYVSAYAAFMSTTATLSAAEHAVVIDAIERGDAEGAEAALRSNWTQATERFVEVMGRLGERGVW
jgi:DNA-binding GntR family transcriptional regulator